MILAIYGAGALGREFKYVADETDDWNEIIFIDDNASYDQLLGCPVYRLEAFLARYKPEEVRFVVAMGEPVFRKAAFERLKNAGFQGGRLIAPSARVSSDAQIGEGALILTEAMVGSLAQVGQNAYISIRATVGHDAVVGDHAKIGVNAFIGGHARIGENAYIGSGAMLRDRIQFGEKSIAGLGAVVFADVPPCVTVIGNPARISSESGGAFLYSASSAQSKSLEPSKSAPAMPDENGGFVPEQLAEKYSRVFDECFDGIDYNPLTFRYRDQGWDSAAQMNLISHLEEAFGIHFGSREILKMTSFLAGLEIVRKKLGQTGDAARKEP